MGCWDSDSSYDLPRWQVAGANDGITATFIDERRVLHGTNVHLAVEACLQLPPCFISDDRAERVSSTLDELVDWLRSLVERLRGRRGQSWTFQVANLTT